MHILEKHGGRAVPHDLRGGMFRLLDRWLPTKTLLPILRKHPDKFEVSVDEHDKIQYFTYATSNAQGSASTIPRRPTATSAPASSKECAASSGETTKHEKTWSPVESLPQIGSIISGRVIWVNYAKTCTRLNIPHCSLWGEITFESPMELEINDDVQDLLVQSIGRDGDQQKIMLEAPDDLELCNDIAASDAMPLGIVQPFLSPTGTLTGMD